MTSNNCACVPVMTLLENATPVIVICCLICVQGKVEKCSGKYLLPSICLPSTYVKEVPPTDLPVIVKGHFGNADIIKLDLKDQTMTVTVGLSIGWMDHRYSGACSPPTFLLVA